ncbi:hypothetical protein MA04_03817 [Alcanivorax balearicus MACL04]|uniref:Transposase n=1 Tax=Alloalcanivorax balearicus MACL04 TaxID=1177182 RepID=A0ABT2R403_9GAMM|nr:hypothetical protein [Alloalcanivorax balearicus MACL04]
MHGFQIPLMHIMYVQEYILLIQRAIRLSRANQEKRKFIFDLNFIVLVWYKIHLVISHPRV